MSELQKIPELHPYIGYTHLAIIAGVAVLFYQGYEPEENGKDKAVAGWRAWIAGKEYGDYVTLVDGLGFAREAYDILLDQATKAITSERITLDRYEQGA